MHEAQPEGANARKNSHQTENMAGIDDPTRPVSLISRHGLLDSIYLRQLLARFPTVASPGDTFIHCTFLPQHFILLNLLSSVFSISCLASPPSPCRNVLRPVPRPIPHSLPSWDSRGCCQRHLLQQRRRSNQRCPPMRSNGCRNSMLLLGMDLLEQRTMFARS